MLSRLIVFYLNCFLLQNLKMDQLLVFRTEVEHFDVIVIQVS